MCSEWSQLEEVSLRDMDVSSAGPRAEIATALPSEYMHEYALAKSASNLTLCDLTIAFWQGSCVIPICD